MYLSCDSGGALRCSLVSHFAECVAYLCWPLRSSAPPLLSVPWCGTGGIRRSRQGTHAAVSAARADALALLARSSRARMSHTASTGTNDRCLREQHGAGRVPARLQYHHARGLRGGACLTSSRKALAHIPCYGFLRCARDSFHRCCGLANGRPSSRLATLPASGQQPEAPATRQHGMWARAFLIVAHQEQTLARHESGLATLASVFGLVCDSSDVLGVWHVHHPPAAV